MENHFLAWWEGRRASYQAVLLDIDGTLIKGRYALPGASETISQLRRERVPFRLLTNDGNRSPAEKCELLARSGIEVAESEIVSCGMALNAFARDPEWRERLFFVIGDLGNPCYADRAGLRTTRDLNDIDNCAGIIIGEGTYDWQLNLNAALNALLQDPGKRLIVPNPDTYWPNGRNGEIGVGAGGKARFLVSILDEAGVEMEPIYLGKPYSAIFEVTLSLMKADFALPDIQPERVLMLGDSLKSDIAGANRMGMVSGLLLTGITDRAMAEKAAAEEKPDFIFDSLVLPVQRGREEPKKKH